MRPDVPVPPVATQSVVVVHETEMRPAKVVGLGLATTDHVPLLSVSMRVLASTPAVVYE